MIRNSVVVKRDVGTVFEYAAQFDRHPEWQSDLEGATFEGPAAVGRGGVETRKMGPRTHSYEWRVSAFDPPHVLGFETLSGPMRPAGTMRFSSEGDGTRVTFEMALNPRGLMRLIAPVIERRVQRTNTEHLDRFRENLERQG